MFTEALTPYLGRLVVACSGGADSLALAHSVVVHAKLHNLPSPCWVYVNHGLREEADEEAKTIAEMALHQGATFRECVVQIAEGSSLEARARDARYQALKAAAREEDADWVLLGHTASDQVETVLMRIFRGTGLAGLAGMPKQRGLFARPLLEYRRQDTEAYCRAHNLLFFEDSMNRDHSFTRVRIRHHWLPDLRRENPKVEEAILRLADSARDYREVLDWARDEFLRQNVDAKGRLEVGEVWQQIPDSLGIRCVSRWADSQGVGELQSLHSKGLLKMLRSSSAGSSELSIPGGRIIREYAKIHIQLGERVEVDKKRWVESVPDGYEIRQWLAGDRMRPRRLKGRSRKLSDLFADAKVPRTQRQNAQVVVRCQDNVIVWAEHVGHSFDATIEIQSELVK